MSVRESIDKRPGVFMAVAAGVILVTCFLVLRNLSGRGASIPKSAFYSVDDGRTFFSDSADRIAPYDYHGKQAYRAMVFSCDGGKTRFVGYLQRVAAEARARLQGHTTSSIPELQRLGPADIEIKKPGAANPWINKSRLDAASQIVAVHCPNGSGAALCLP